jgi:hypothetical protein
MWEKSEVRSFGVDIFETHTALANGFVVKQAFLGAKDHDQKDPGKQLSSMFRQVVSSMFSCVEAYEKTWKPITGMAQIEIVGNKRRAEFQGPVPVDIENMLANYVVGFDRYFSLYRSILSDDLIQIFEKIKNLDAEYEPFLLAAWAKVVFLFMAAFHRSDEGQRNNLIDALRILWTGRLASFIRETENLGAEETEAKIEEQAQVFEQMKPYLVDLF